MPTLRSDFLGVCQLHPAHLIRPADQVLLGLIREESLRQVIEGPASRVGLHLERLSHWMPAETGGGDSLPLLVR